MYVTMLGTGAAFADPDRAQSGILVTLDNGVRYMFDCGAGKIRPTCLGADFRAGRGFARNTRSTVRHARA